MRGLLAIIAVLLVLGCVLPWATHATPPQNTPIVALGLPRSINPCVGTTLDEFRLLSSLFEPLVRLDARTLQPKPALAERWDTNADQSVWTFHLDPRARWHDGKKVVAADIRRGLLRHLITQSPNAFYLDGLIKGAACDLTDLDQRRVMLERDCALRCPDDHTLVVELTHPTPYLTAILSLAAFVPIREEYDREDDYARQIWTDPTRLIGNGPFRCTDYKPRHHYDFTPSPTYGGAHPARGPVRALIVDNPGTALRLYLSGEVDAVLLLTSDAVGDLKRNRVAGLQQVPSLQTTFIRVRVKANPDDRPEVIRALQHPRLRRALATGFDRRVLTDHLLQGNATPATTFVPAALGDYMPYRAPVTVLAYQLEQAKVDIAAAKADLGTLPPLELIASSMPAERQSVAELVADHWRRNLGITVNLTFQPPTEVRSREQQIDYEMAIGGWLGDFLDPTTFLDCFRTNAGANRTGYADPEYDRLLDAATVTIGDARWQALEAAERRLVEGIPLIPLYHNVSSFLVRPGLDGISANPLEIVNFDEVTWSVKH